MRVPVQKSNFAALSLTPSTRCQLDGVAVRSSTRLTGDLRTGLLEARARVRAAPRLRVVDARRGPEGDDAEERADRCELDYPEKYLSLIHI